MSAEMDEEAAKETSQLTTQETDHTAPIEPDRTESDTKKQNWLVTWAKNTEGATAWFLLFRVFVGNTLAGINYIIFSLLYVEYSIYFDAPKAVLGLIRSLQTVAVILGSLFMSWPVEKFGYPRMAFLGSMLSVVGLISASFSPSIVMLYFTQGLVAGFGYGTVNLCSPVVVQRHFNQNRAFANGISTMGYSAGNIIGPMITKVFLEHYGWRGTLLLIGGISLNRAAIGLTLHPPDDQPQKVDTSTNSCGKAIRKTLDFSLIKNKTYSLFLVAVFLQSFYANAFLNFTPIRAVHAGMSIQSAAFLTTATFIASITVHVISVFVTNLKCVNYIVLFSAGTGLGVPAAIFTLLVPNFYGSLVGCIFFGLSVGSIIPVFTLILLELCGLENLVRALSLLTLSMGSASLLAIPLCGWLYDVSGTYNIAFVLMGCAAGFSSLISIIVIFVNRRNKSQSRETPQLEENEKL